MSSSRYYLAPSGKQYIVPETLFAWFSQQTGGEPERSLIEWIHENYLHPDYAFVDIGAHIGTYSLHFHNRSREVAAFEPSLANYNRLCGGIALAGASGKIRAVHTALSDHTGFESLRIPSEDGGLSTLETWLPHAPPGVPIEKVPVHTLDSYCLEKVGLIKVDVEGHEARVLRGAEQTIRRSGFPRILIEVWPDDWFREQRVRVFQDLERLGYKLTPIHNFAHMQLAEHPQSTVRWTR